MFFSLSPGKFSRAALALMLGISLLSCSKSQAFSDSNPSGAHSNQETSVTKPESKNAPSQEMASKNNVKSKNEVQSMRSLVNLYAGGPTGRSHKVFPNEIVYSIEITEKVVFISYEKTDEDSQKLKEFHFKFDLKTLDILRIAAEILRDIPELREESDAKIARAILPVSAVEKSSLEIDGKRIPCNRIRVLDGSFVKWTEGNIVPLEDGHVDLVVVDREHLGSEKFAKIVSRESKVGLEE